MTRVDFYVIADERAGARARTACRLAEKAWTQGHRVVVLAGSEAEAHRLDNLLWTFREDSFVPHDVYEERPGGEPDPAAAAPVLLAAGTPPPEAGDVLINFTDDVPLSYARYTRIAEIVDGTESSRSAGRDRFRFYRDHGCDVHSHNL